MNKWDIEDWFLFIAALALVGLVLSFSIWLFS